MGWFGLFIMEKGVEMKRGIIAFIALQFFSSTGVYAELYDRGGGLIYDDFLNITWLQNANYAFTSGYDPDGLMNWYEANEWAEQLIYDRYTDWRLPDGGDQSDGGEMGYMYRNNLNGSSSIFYNVQPDYYWSKNEYTNYPEFAYLFHFGNGDAQVFSFKVSPASAWAVRDGDSSPVPIPSAVWLLGSGLIGFIGAKKKLNNI